MKQIYITFAFLLCMIGATAQSGTITNIIISQGTGSDERLVDILFDLTGSDPFYDITLEVSFDNGSNYAAIDNSNVTGTLTVAPEKDIHLVWNGRVNYSLESSSFSRIKVIATTFCTSTVSDIDGNSYSTVGIGTQCWMQENLKVTKYPNGEAITSVTNNTAWHNLDDNNTDEAYCYYNNNINLEYGALYTYAAAIADNWTRDNANGQGICPDGWHLPTAAEWNTLSDYLGGSSVAGGKMKEAGISHWYSPNAGATNESGFTALPGGYRSYDNGTFGFAGHHGYWWSATEGSSYDAWYRRLYYNRATVYRYDDNKSYGFSVRCIRD